MSSRRQMISLRLQGVYGTYIPGSVSMSAGNAGSFQLSNNGLVGYSAGGPVTVNTFNFTSFFNLTGLSQLADHDHADSAGHARFVAEGSGERQSGVVRGLVSDSGLQLTCNRSILADGLRAVRFSRVMGDRSRLSIDDSTCYCADRVRPGRRRETVQSGCFHLRPSPIIAA